MNESCEIAAKSEKLVQCCVDSSLRRKDGLFEVCAMLGEEIIILSGLVVSDERVYSSFP